MKPLRKTRPQHASYACDDCDGDGATIAEDWDDEGAVFKVAVRCEGCSGSGSMTSCDCCDEAMPLGEAELNGYVCGPCIADARRGTRARVAASAID